MLQWLLFHSANICSVFHITDSATVTPLPLNNNCWPSDSHGHSNQLTISATVLPVHRKYSN